MPLIPSNQAEYDPSGFFAALVERMAQERSEIVERAVEEALQHGSYGVLVLNCPDGTFMAKEHPQVPYGHLYEAPTAAMTTEALRSAFIGWRPAAQ